MGSFGRVPPACGRTGGKVVRLSEARGQLYKTRALGRLFGGEKVRAVWHYGYQDEAGLLKGLDNVTSADEDNQVTLRVRYLADGPEREAFRVTFGDDGKLRHGQGLLDTTSAKAMFPGRAHGWFIFAMDGDGRLYAADNRKEFFGGRELPPDERQQYPGQTSTALKGYWRERAEDLARRLVDGLVTRVFVKGRKTADDEAGATAFPCDHYASIWLDHEVTCAMAMPGGVVKGRPARDLEKLGRTSWKKMAAPANVLKNCIKKEPAPVVREDPAPASAPPAEGEGNGRRSSLGGEGEGYGRRSSLGGEGEGYGRRSSLGGEGEGGGDERRSSLGGEGGGEERRSSLGGEGGGEERRSSLGGEERRSSLGGEEGRSSLVGGEGEASPAAIQEGEGEASPYAVQEGEGEASPYAVQEGGDANGEADALASPAGPQAVDWADLPAPDDAPSAQPRPAPGRTFKPQALEACYGKFQPGEGVFVCGPPRLASGELDLAALAKLVTPGPAGAKPPIETEWEARQDRHAQDWERRREQDPAEAKREPFVRQPFPGLAFAIADVPAGGWVCNACLVRRAQWPILRWVKLPQAQVDQAMAKLRAGGDDERSFTSELVRLGVIGAAMADQLAPLGHVAGQRLLEVFHHSSFLAGEPVAAAGELRVEQGVITRLTNDSGHFLPSPRHLLQATRELKRQEADLRQLQVHFEGHVDKEAPPGPDKKYPKIWLPALAGQGLDPRLVAAAKEMKDVRSPAEGRPEAHGSRDHKLAALADEIKLGVKLRPAAAREAPLPRGGPEQCVGRDAHDFRCLRTSATEEHMEYDEEAGGWLCERCDNARWAWVQTRARSTKAKA